MLEKKRMPMRDRMTRGIIYTLSSAVLYGAIPVLHASTFAYGNNALTIALCDSLGVLPVLAVIAVRRRTAMRVNGRQLLAVALTALCGPVLATVLLTASYRYIGIGTATAIHFMYPVMVAALLMAVFHSRPSRRTAAALTLAVAGAMMFVDWRDRLNIIGLGLALASALCYAIYLVLIDRTSLKDMDDYKVSLYLALLAAALLCGYGSVSGQLRLDQPLVSYLLMAAAALLGPLAAFVMLKRGIRLIGSRRASLYCLAEPLVSLACGTMFLDEKVTWTKMVGSAVLAAALAMMSWHRRAKRRKPVQARTPAFVEPDCRRQITTGRN
mgnify:CR=1 FL=1